MSRRSSISSCFLLLAAILCMGSLLVGVALLGIPNRAEAAFGPPAPTLDAFERTYLSALLLFQKNDLTHPADQLGTEQPFQVEIDESPGSIASRLEAQGLIRNASAFINYLRYSGLDTSVQAGKYELNSNMTTLEIARALQDATPGEVTFQILAGWRMEEVAEALPTSGLNISPEVFKEAASRPPSDSNIANELPPKASLEGFLFPGAYLINRATTADGLIAILLSAFEAQVDSDLRAGFQRQGLSLYEAVTLASMVQREAMVEDEMPLIASVFLNRQKMGMKLDSDPTVQYALGYNARQKTWWTNPLSLDDLKVSSSYNTYLAPGLPPGPISNPGLNALRAVAFPAQTPYFYFRAACDGSGRHNFAKTFDEHVNHACP